MQTFSFRASLKKSWETYKNNWKMITGLLLIYWIGTMVINMLLGRHEAISALFMMIIALIIPIISTQLFITLADTGTLSWSSIHLSWSAVWKFAVVILIGLGLFITGTVVIWAPVGIIFGLLHLVSPTAAMIVGVILGIISGIIWLFAVVFAGFKMYFLVPVLCENHQNLGPWRIVKKTWHMTDRYLWELFGFVAQQGLIMILGYMVLIVGAVVTMPVSMIIKMDLYRHLTRGQQN